MAVADIMTRKLITVTPKDTVKTLFPLFKQHGIHHLLVVEDVTLLGVISDRDVLRVISPYANTQVADSKDLFTLGRTATQIMSKKLVTVPSTSGIREACKVLLENKVSLLPIVDSKRLVGVLSWKDILRHFVD